MKILAFETSCDETGIALIEEKQGQVKVLANLVASQTETHRPYGGVVPNLAKREHQKNLPLLLDQLTVSLRSYAHGIENVDLIAVTQGPGLAPCLWAGINFAQELAQKLNKPLVGINHLKGHIYIALSELTNPKFQETSSKIQISTHPFGAWVLELGAWLDLSRNKWNQREMSSPFYCGR